MNVRTWDVDYCGHVTAGQRALAQSIADALPCGEVPDDYDAIVDRAIADGVRLASPFSPADVKKDTCSDISEHFSFVPILDAE